MVAHPKYPFLKKNTRRPTIPELVKDPDKSHNLGFPKHHGFKPEATYKQIVASWSNFGKKMFGEYWGWNPDEKTLHTIRKSLGQELPRSLKKMGESAFGIKKEGKKSFDDKRNVREKYEDWEDGVRTQEKSARIRKTFEKQNPELAVGTAWLIEEIGKLPENARKRMETIIRNQSMATLGALDELHNVKVHIKPKIQTTGDFAWVFNEEKKLKDEISELRKRGIRASLIDLMHEFKKKSQKEELRAMQKLLGKDKLDEGIVNIMHKSCVEYANEMYSPEFMEFLRKKYHCPTNAFLFGFDMLTLNIRNWRASKSMQKRAREFFRRNKSLRKSLEFIASKKLE